MPKSNKAASDIQISEEDFSKLLWCLNLLQAKAANLPEPFFPSCSWNSYQDYLSTAAGRLLAPTLTREAICRHTLKCCLLFFFFPLAELLGRTTSFQVGTNSFPQHQHCVIRTEDVHFNDCPTTWWTVSNIISWIVQFSNCIMCSNTTQNMCSH